MNETVRISPARKSPDPLPQMAGDTLQAILTGGRYPATLYQQTQLRIKAERKITYGRAAIIKAYLLRNTENENYKEALQVELNDKPHISPMFWQAVCRGRSDSGNGQRNCHHQDRYFSTACATPAVAFPMVLKLAEIHLRKLEGGLRVSYARQLAELTALIGESYNKQHNLYDQGIFQLGYYHQTQKRYAKKEKSNDISAKTDELKEDN
jgi:CRISPR-associated protein Csd1